jgi:peptidoglycan/LPS O-acetylase OafA/YrhL
VIGLDELYFQVSKHAPFLGHLPGGPCIAMTSPPAVDMKDPEIRAAGGYRPDVDGLRAVGVLSVLAFHAFPRIVPGGFIGVDVFFVISGFLIGGIIFRSLAAGSFSFLEFYAKRVRRIFPALIVVLLAALGIGWWTLYDDEFRQLWNHVAGGAGFLANIFEWRESGYFDALTAEKPLLHLWSLGVEEQFYFVWPLMLWVAWKLRMNLVFPILLVGLISFALNIWVVRFSTPAAFYSPFTRFWELSAGSFLAVWPRPKYQSSLLRETSAICGALLVVAGLFAFSSAREYPGWRALVPTIGACLLIMAGPKSFVSRNLLANPFAIWIGLISYPLYLWHWPLISFASIVYGGMPPVVIRLLIVAASVALAWLTYRFVEKPIRRPPLGNTAPIALTVLLGIIGVVAVCGYVLKGRFLPQGNLSSLPGLSVSVDSLRNAHDLPQAFTCMPKLRGLGVVSDRCASNSNVPRVVVMGDSHAGHLYPGLVGSDVPLEVIWNAGCPPMSELPLIHSCDTRWRALETYVSDHRSSIRVVVLTAYYALYVSPQNLSGHHNEQFAAIKKQLPANSNGIEGASKVLMSGLENSISFFESRGIKVILALDVPELQYQPKACFPRTHFPYANSGIACIGTPRSVVDLRNSQMQKIADDLSKTHPHLAVFDPTPLLCDQSLCYPTKDNRLVYRDDDHLNDDGSKVVGAGLLRLIDSEALAK